jgi:polysaccharide export outer membrane protein
VKSFPKRMLGVSALAAACLLLLPGCSSENRAYEKTSVPAERDAVNSGLAAVNMNPALEALWTARRANAKDFAIGPGDVLQIQVTRVKELEDRTVRVDGKGDIDLPLLGSLHVAGLSEHELNSLLVSKLGDFLYHPQAQIFVKSYNNRQVAVTGEVKSPADYTLNGPEDTVRELIQRAGGVTLQASPEIVLTLGPVGIAEGATSPTEAKDNYSAASYDSSSQASSTNSSRSVDASSTVAPPFIIDLSRNSPLGRYLDLPVRPGDTIFVPAAGTVSTVGWVYRTQTIPITRNLSVIGAVAASGGTLFAANEHQVQIVRRQTNGERAVMTVDVASIRAGKSPDVPLQDGDIIDVPYSAYKIPGYAIYYAAKGIVSYTPPAAVAAGGL